MFIFYIFRKNLTFTGNIIQKFLISLEWLDIKLMWLQCSITFCFFPSKFLTDFWCCHLFQPELVQRVEKDLLNIMTGATVENADILKFKSNFSIVVQQRKIEKMFFIKKIYRSGKPWMLLQIQSIQIPSQVIETISIVGQSLIFML